MGGQFEEGAAHLSGGWDFRPEDAPQSSPEPTCPLGPSLEKKETRPVPWELTEP